ncbi:MAG: hypothetical protein KC613_13725 [Myxococcales bacterium]|nr:hypothetical protein [Myxococcales bacterium]MCB9523718.1 hypothetical protein [Myxococcales bacterium]
MARRHSEDSVIASIDQVQAMLRDEVRPSPPAELALPPEAATQITHRAGYRASDEPSDLDVLPNLAVPTAAEVEASRAARWAEEAAVTPVVGGRRRTGGVFRVLLALGLLATAGAGGWVVADLRPPATSVAPLVRAADDAVASVVSTHRGSVQEATVARLESELSAARARAHGLQATVAELQAASVASKPEPAAAPVQETKVKRRRQVGRTRGGLLVTRPERAKRSQRPLRRRPARKLTRQDKRLDALINGL